MSDFQNFLAEQLKSEEFRREYEALAPDYELVLRGDVDPRNLCYLIKMDGTEYNDYERGYNDGVIAAYWLTRQARKIEAEPVVHAHWIDTGDSFEDEHCRYNYWECSACRNRIAGRYGLHDYCPNCGAHMDEEV